ncbi:hypothetical protein GS493_05640 [Rhodococcus hoagii]|nr:hypothetical protein [Prescottella equi]
MVDGEEWVIRSAMSENYDRELAMINAGTFPKLPGFENGGRIAAQRAHAGLAPEAGKPYGYGQVGNPSWDCSSYSGLAHALLKGLDTAVRWYTTESNFLGLGFRPGMGPSSALNVGVHNGGGGTELAMTSMLDGVVRRAPMTSSTRSSTTGRRRRSILPETVLGGDSVSTASGEEGDVD